MQSCSSSFNSNFYCVSFNLNLLTMIIIPIKRNSSCCLSSMTAVLVFRLRYTYTPGLQIWYRCLDISRHPDNIRPSSYTVCRLGVAQTRRSSGTVCCECLPWAFFEVALWSIPVWSWITSRPGTVWWVGSSSSPTVTEVSWFDSAVCCLVL